MQKNVGKRKNILSMGFASLFTDMSTEMIVSILPVFITSVLGAPKAVLGLIEGLAEATSSILKYISGKLSDKSGKRKPFIVGGYSLSAISKPLLALANNWQIVLLLRFTERSGKGLRTSARDALLAESGGKQKRGRSFGFHRAMDNLGAGLGALSAFFLLKYGTAYSTLFILSFIPAFIAVIILLIGLKEIHQNEEITSEVETVQSSSQFKKFLLVIFIFSLANISYAFFLTRANEIGMKAYLIPIMYLIYQLVGAIFAYPIGKLSDKIGCKTFLQIAFGIFTLTSLLFGIIDKVWMIPLLFLLYGCFFAIYDTISRIMVSGYANKKKMGGTYGSFHTLIGLTALPVNILAGYIWDNYSAGVLFTFASGISILALILTVPLIRGKKIVRG